FTEFCITVEQPVIDQLHCDRHDIQPVPSLYKDLVMRSDLINLKEHFLYLCREYIYSADDKHIVRTSGDILHPACCTPALARFIHQSCKVSRPVSHKRQSLFAKTGHYKLSQFSRRKHFLCLRIDDLRNKPVFIDMHTAKLCTLTCDSRTAEFAHTIILCTDELVSPDFMHLIPHRLCHSLASKK